MLNEKVYDLYTSNARLSEVIESFVRESGTTAREHGFDGEPEEKRLAREAMLVLESMGLTADGVPQEFTDLPELILTRPNYNVAEKIALMHSELSELLEAHRHGQLLDPSEHIPGFTKEEEELSDLAIRLFQYASLRGEKVRLGEAILSKMEFNRTRPHKHGKAY